MSQQDQSTGVVSSLRNMGVQFASLRWAQTQHAILYGPTMTLNDKFLKGAAKGVFSWRASEQEMTKIRAGVTVGGRILKNVPLGGKARNVGNMYGSWMNSPFAVSKWTTAANLMGRPGAYTKQASRVLASEGFIEGTAAARARAGGMLGTTKKGIFKFEINGAKNGWLSKTPSSNYEDVADLAYARQWTSSALKFGHSNFGNNARLGGLVNKGLNMGTGLMFDVDDDLVKTGIQNYKGKFEKARSALGYIDEASVNSKSVQSVIKNINKGATIRTLGADSGFTLSKFGRAVGGLSKFAGGALMAVSIYDTAKMLGEGAWNLGEMAFYSPAKRGFSDMNRFATRGSFGQIGPQGWLQSPTASTNRARAVQAIQGSKMNARSALGNEASLLSGHFG